MNRFLLLKPAKRWLALIIFVVLAALLLQACAEGATQPDESPPAGVSSTAAPTLAGAPTQAQTSPSVTGEGMLRVALQPLVQTDPAFVSTDPEVLFANSVYDYLVDIAADNQIAPRLATDWSISDDGKSYVFQLAQGVSFHDGSPLTAQDVVWTFDRLRDPGADLPTKDLYSNIDTIEATGEHEVTFKLKETNPFFLYDLSDNHALVLKAGTQDPGKDYNGTGPFIVDSYVPEDRMVLLANGNYFVEGEPKLSGVEFIFFNDQTAMVDALRSGQVDLVMRISSDLYTGLKNETGLNLLEVPTNQFDLVRLRADQEPGNDPRVIQALKLATDREAIFQLVLQGYGNIGRDSPIGPLYSDYYTEEATIPGRDVEAARQMLSEAGYEEGLNLEMHVPDTGDRPNLAVVLKQQWEEAGVNVDVLVEPESVYYGENGWLEVNLGITGWGSRPYPQFYLDVMLKCDAVWNEAHFCDPELDQLIDKAGTTMDEAERVQAYHDIQRILIERGPIIIPYFAAQLGAIRDQFQGFEMKDFPGRSDFRDVSVANP